MNYHDTGTKEPGQTLGKWFADVLNEEVIGLRIQTGYFRLGAAKALVPVLERIVEYGFDTHIVIGSNDSDTLHSEISKLFTKLGMPRDTAKLAIVQFSNALFHPKVYHITRNDGSQAAFVGSANFTEVAITGGNVEAAISLDTRLGDSVDVLNEIAAAIDHWLIGDCEQGTWRVTSQDDIDSLLEIGVLSVQRAQREYRSQSDTRQTGGLNAARRPKLIVLPPWPDNETDELDDEDVDQERAEPLSDVVSSVLASAEPIKLPALDVQEPTDGFELSVEVRDDFPDYIKFEPGTEGPTSGWTALSGAKFSEPYVGLIMKLTRDSARHFSGGSGTANISIPVAVAGTFRFGVYPNSGRPRAEFSLRIRYHGVTLNVEQLCNTNVMAYGVLPTDTGHGDLRMVLPKAVTKLADEITKNGLALPMSDDLFLLEWPSENADYFTLTFLENGCVEHKLVVQAYAEATQAKQILGSSCGLKKNISPQW